MKKKVKVNYKNPTTYQVKINGKLTCPECGEKYEEEPRCEVWLKCGRCAYSHRER